MGNIRKSFFCVVVCVGLVAAVHAAAPEKTLGTVSLGDPYKNVRAKNPFLPSNKDLEPALLPYPQNVLDKKPVLMVTHPSLNMVLYVDRKTSKIRALSTFEATGAAPQSFETGAGLRVGDTVQTVRLLYGEPAKISSYVYYFPEKQRVEQRIFYYPDMCLHTATKGTAEVVTGIVLGSYDMGKTLIACQQPLQSKALIPSAQAVVPASEPVVQQSAVVMPAGTAAPEVTKKTTKRSFFGGRKKGDDVAVSVVVPTPQAAVTPTVVVLPKQSRPVKKKPTEKKEEVLVEQKIEISERVAAVSPEFKALIAQPEWRYKVRYDEKTSELVVTFRMTRASLDALTATPEGKPYAQVLEGLFSQL